MSYFSKAVDAYMWHKIMDMLLAYSTADGSEVTGCLSIYVTVLLIEDYHTTACLHT